MNKKLKFNCAKWILTLWVGSLLLLLVFQLLGFNVGFKIWPLGEDRNWLHFILTSKPKYNMVHLFWDNDQRNPLSPWWWFLISKIIILHPYALYMVRKSMDLFLAITVFSTLDKLNNQNGRLNSFCIAVAVLFWNFSFYEEQIIWNFLGAMIFNILALNFYLRFLKKNRKGYDLAFGMLCYFVAISTYTLQSGAIFGVVLIGLLTPQNTNNFLTKIKNTFFDTLVFASVLVVFLMIWFTVKTRGFDYFYAFSLSRFYKQFVSSLSYFLYPTELLSWSAQALKDFGMLVCLVGVLLSTIFLYWLFNKASYIYKNVKFNYWSTIILFLTIATPTVFTEALSQVWLPGTRTAMVVQVSQPLLILSLVFLLCVIFPLGLRLKVQNFLISIVISCAILSSISFNYHLSLRTLYQENLAEQINILYMKSGIKYYLIMYKNNEEDLDTIPLTLSGYYMQTVLDGAPVVVRPIMKTSNPLLKKYWKVRFLDDSIGVINGREMFNAQPVSYKDLRIIRYDGKKVYIPKYINHNDFQDYNVDWKRVAPIKQ